MGVYYWSYGLSVIKLGKEEPVCVVEQSIGNADSDLERFLAGEALGFDGVLETVGGLGSLTIVNGEVGRQVEILSLGLRVGIPVATENEVFG